MGGRLIREMMGMRNIGLLVVCLILLPVLMVEGVRERMGRKGLSLRSLLVASPKLDEDLIWLCGMELLDIKEVKSSSSSVGNLVSDPTETRLYPNFCMLKVMTSLSPAIQHAFLRCMNNKGFQLLDSNNVNRLGNTFKECFGHPILRRHLAQRIIGNEALASPGPASILTPAPAPAPAPIPSPTRQVEAPTPAPASIPSPTAQVEAPTPIPISSHDVAAVSSPSPDAMDESPLEANSITPGAAPFLRKEGNSQKTTVIIAAVLSTAGTSLVIACLFFCYKRCFKEDNDSTYGRDESPLLNLTLSDLSGSSQKSSGRGASVHKDKLGPVSFKTEVSQNGHIVDINSGETLESNRMSGYSIASTAPSFPPVLPPPPGMPNRYTAVSLPPSVPPLAPSPPASTPSTPPPPPPVPPPPPGRPSLSNAAPLPPAPPPPIPSAKPGPRPPPPPKGAVPGRPPLGGSKATHLSTSGPNRSGDASAELDDGAHKAKLKPFFWDKVLANPDQSMVWHQIKSGSFQFDEDMIETLFGYNSAAKSSGVGKKESSSNVPSTQYIQLLDPKKSQNLAISLKALNAKTEVVREALMEGNELHTELLQTLLRMQPTTDEELKLRLYNGDISRLGPAEQFLKALIDIPFAYRRMDVLLFMSSLHEDVSSIKESFATLEAACTELRNSRLFLKLLEAVLKTGNRMNDGTFRGGAQAFKLDTLLKLSDVKGSDGKTTLLHFVVQEIIRSEGVRAARVARESGSMSSLTSYSFNSDDFAEDSPRDSEEYYRNLGLKVVSGLSSELENVKKAAGLDVEALTSMVASFGHRLVSNKEFLNTEMKNLAEDSGFHQVLKYFAENAEAAITFLLEEEKKIRLLVQKTTDYFHGNAGKDEGLRLFVIVRDFLGMLDKECKKVRETPKRVTSTPKVRNNSNAPPIPDPRQLLFPAIMDRRVDDSSSDEEGP